MKLQLLISLALGSLLVACGTPKKEQRVPIETRDSADVQTPPSEFCKEETEFPSDGVDVNTADSSSSLCQPAGPAPEQVPLEANTLYVQSLNSYRQFEVDTEGRILKDQGSCAASLLFPSSAVEIRLGTLPLEANAIGLGQSAQCLIDLEVRYQTGTMFAIRKIAVPLLANLHPESSATFKGTYGIKGRNSPPEAVQVIGRELDDREVLVEKVVADQDLQWSNCSGRDTLRFDQQLGLNFATLPSTPEAWERALAEKKERPFNHGTFQVRDDASYRLELIWARCPN